MTVGGRRTEDTLAAVIDIYIDHVARTLSTHARHARTRLRERDPIARLGLDIILSTLQEIADGNAFDALKDIPAVRAGEWWLVPNVSVPGATHLLVIAGGDRVACIQPHNGQDRRLDHAELVVKSMLTLLDDTDYDVTAIVAMGDQRVQFDWACTPSGHVIAITGIQGLASAVIGEFDLGGPYDPDRNPRLSRALHAARRYAEQRGLATAGLLHELDDRWLIAPAARLAGLPLPVGVLVVGPAGVFVCEPAGIDPYTAASDAIAAARHVAWRSRGMRTHITPVVLCDPDVRPHQLALGDGARAWALPADQAVSSLSTVKRAGLQGRRMRRLHNPAPGWHYRVVSDADGWMYDIRYVHQRHPLSGHAFGLSSAE